MADDAPRPDAEKGTAVDRRNLLFSEWDDQLYLTNPTRPSDRELDRMLERDGKARQLEQALTLPLRQAAYTLKPGKGDSGELEFVQRVLETPANAGGMTTPLGVVIGQATSAVTHRRSFHEKVWTEQDGRLVYAKLAFRPQASCRIKRDDNGSFNGFQQFLGIGKPNTDANGWTTIDPKNAWVHIHGTHRDPLGGVSDLDVAYNNHVTKAKIKFLWHQFLENSALPKTAVKVPQVDDRNKAARTVAGLHNAGVVGVGTDWNFEHFPVGQGQPFIDCITYLDAETAGSCLAGMLNLTDPAKTGGSYALSKDATDFFLMSLQSKLTELGTSLSNFVIADLVRWNFGPEASSPELVFEKLAGEDLDRMLTALEYTAAQRGQGVPAEFVDQLVLKVAEKLDMPVDKVAASIRSEQQTAPSGEVGQVQSAVDTATRLVRQRDRQRASLRVADPTQAAM